MHQMMADDLPGIVFGGRYRLRHLLGLRGQRDHGCIGQRGCGDGKAQSRGRGENCFAHDASPDFAFMLFPGLAAHKRLSRVSRRVDAITAA
jgi:hypothetical protein